MKHRYSDDDWMRIRRVRRLYALITGGRLESLVHGCIRNSIDAHGEITLQNSSSAAKRIANQIGGFLKTQDGLEEANILAVHGGDDG